MEQWAILHYMIIQSFQQSNLAIKESIQKGFLGIQLHYQGCISTMCTCVIHNRSAVVITGTPCEVTNLYISKCTVATACILLTHLVQRIMLYKKYMEIFFQAYWNILCSNASCIWRDVCCYIIVLTWCTK